MHGGACSAKRGHGVRTDPERPMNTSSASLLDHDPALQRATSVALITGGSRGVGRILAEALCRRGVRVGLIARSRADLDEAASVVTAGGGVAAVAVADVTDAGQLACAVSDIARDLGPIDLLVNNAGVVGPIGPLWEIDADDWWKTMEVNVRGVVRTTEAVLPQMVARRRGRVINVSSQAGVHRWPLVSAYSVSKGAVTKLSENLAHEVSRFGISVFSVPPGLLAVGMGTTVLESTPADRFAQHVKDWTATELREGRGATPAQAVELIMRLAAGDADVLTGCHISVHDDLDAMLRRSHEIQSRDLYVLHPMRLTETARAPATSDGHRPLFNPHPASNRQKATMR